MERRLPEEVWRRILELGVERRRLTFIDVCCLCMTSRLFRRLAGESSLWSALLAFDFSNPMPSHSAALSCPKTVYKNRTLTTFEIGRNVEIKGFGKWIGTTLLGHVVGHFKKSFYIVDLWGIVDPDHSGDYDKWSRDEEYYIIKQEQFQIIHQRFVRDAIPDQPNQDLNIGDIVNWNDRSIMRKGVIVGKIYGIDAHLGPDEAWTYFIKVEGSDETDSDYWYRIRPHVPWI